MGVLLYSYVSSEVLGYISLELKTSNSSSKSDDSNEYTIFLSSAVHRQLQATVNILGLLYFSIQ